MRHLFIINPKASKIKGRTSSLKAEIAAFFNSYSQIPYDIHVTRWCRDAVGFTRRYVSNTDSLVRIHVLGGTGTLFEVVNGVIGIPNVQVAFYPYGRCNSLVRYFGESKLHLFASIRNQVFSDTTPIDAVRCGHNYSLCYCIAGLEAEANFTGDKWIAATPFPDDLCYFSAALYTVVERDRLGRDYKITVDGESYDGRYITIMAANQPCYGICFNPGIDAHPNDGILDLYMMVSHPKISFLKNAYVYTSGYYDKIPNIIAHRRCRKISIFSEQPICIGMDGEIFFEETAEFEIVPYAIDFVCPSGIDPKKLPRIYNRPEEGCVDDGYSKKH